MRKPVKSKIAIAMIAVLVLSLSMLLAACNNVTNTNNIYAHTFDEIPAGENYLRCDVNGKAKADGGYILFGSYPQTLKAGNVSITDAAVDADGYFTGSDGAKYAKTEAAPYKENYKFNNGDKIKKSTYYFKISPILWRIVKEEGKDATLICMSILDTDAYTSLENCKDAKTGKTIYNLKNLKFIPIESSDVPTFRGDIFKNVKENEYKEMTAEEIAANTLPAYAKAYKGDVVAKKFSVLENPATYGGDKYIKMNLGGDDVFVLSDTVRLTGYEGDVYKMARLYSNDWENCDTREWLNGAFFNASFDANQTSILKKVALDNKTTAVTANEAYATCQENTEDFVYLPSYADVSNRDKAYGFSDTNRKMITSDYARSKGTWMIAGDKKAYGNGWWLTRSPSGNPATGTDENGNRLCAVFYDGTLISNGVYHAPTVVNGNVGIVPMVTITLK